MKGKTWNTVTRQRGTRWRLTAHMQHIRGGSIRTGERNECCQAGARATLLQNKTGNVGEDYSIFGVNMWNRSTSSDWKIRKCNRRHKRCQGWGANGPVVHHRCVRCLGSARSHDPGWLSYFPHFHLGRLVMFSWNHLHPQRFRPQREIPTITEFRTKQKSWDLSTYSCLSLHSLSMKSVERRATSSRLHLLDGWRDRHQSFIWEEPDRLSRL